MKTAKIIFPHQLFQKSALLEMDAPHFLVEEFLFFKQYNFHKQKIAFHRATMKFYETHLKEQGYNVTYIEAQEETSDIRKLIAHLYDIDVRSIAIIDPVDDWLMRRIKSTCDTFHINLHVMDSPLFLNTETELSHYFKATKKKFFQTEFYKQERIKRKILLDASGGPAGGKWSFDEDNRKKFPKGKKPTLTIFPAADFFTKEANVYAEKHFADNIGTLNKSAIYPIGFEASEAWLTQFLENRLAEFGDYEDAIVRGEMVIHHSMLTPMLNVGMITPKYVLERTIHMSAAHAIPLNSMEGFVRQIIGWREFIRGVYIIKGREERTRNYWGFTRKIPRSFYNGTTGIVPVDDTIKKVLKTGYCHHIERLMVLGNFMLLCEFDPDEVYRWFMELFIDAYDWVMVPNVYGMSQFADGGMLSTKPYISGSNYIMKMSDYPKGEWQTTWDALFWRFMDVHRSFFLQNPRLGMLIRTYDKWDEGKKKTTLRNAETYLEKLDGA
jgi:deoxyribodipyrimidine photolyase-related protein